MKSANDIEPADRPAAREVPIVAVPAAVFQQILDQLSTQPYKDVGALMGVLLTYKAQMAQVEG